jgi:nanoRNase/pAp phosphatase (c-di-AMP/oligoRNAs hydrolase)
MKDVLKALKALEGRTLILTHHNADADAVASSLALKRLIKNFGVEADLGAAESVSKPAQKLAERNFIIDPDCSQYDHVVLVETSVPEQLASVKNVRADIIIDHHPAGKLADGVTASWIDERYKSCSQMILELYRESGVAPDRTVALWLAVGITADTAHLRLAGLKEFEDMVSLFKAGAEFSEVLKLLETPVDLSERIAVLKALSRVDVWRIGDLLLAVSHVKSHEAASCRALVKTAADVAVVVAERDDEVRISSRGRDWILGKGVDLSVIFKEVGRIVGGSGGGHNLAGSANGPDKKAVDAAVKHVRKELETAMKAQAQKLD